MCRKCMVPKLTLVVCTVLTLALAHSARADDDNVIAGILSGNPGCNVYSFDSYGGQILFAEAAAEFYQSRGRSSGGGCDQGEGSPTETAAVSEGSCTDGGSDGGCTDGGSSGGCTDGGSSGGCTEGGSGGGCGCGDSTTGPNDLCLQVINSSGQKICWAGRPIRPGWQRDPRLACHLEQEGEYSLFVFRGKCGSTPVCDAGMESGNPDIYPTYYLLWVRLVDVENSEGKLFPPSKVQ